MITYNNVSFIRDSRVIIDGITFQINKDENWAILGPNGSGKSTLFSMLMAYTIPSKGTIEAYDIEFGKGNWNRVKEKIGIVSSTMDRFEEVLKSQIVFEVVLSGLKKTIGIYEEITGEEIETTRKLLEKFSMLDMGEKSFGTLSQGEKREVMVLRSLVAKPELLILDEPCASLDLFQKEYLLKTLTSIVEDTNIIYITHDINEIMPFITHIMLIKEGNVYQSGPKEEVLTSENLSGLYDLEIELKWKNGRPWVHVLS